MSRVYIASALGAAPVADHLSVALAQCGHHITSRWVRSVIDGGLTRDPGTDHDRLAVLESNYDDLLRTEVLVFVAHTGTPRGAFVEVGWALACCMPVVWVHGPAGEGRAIFDSAPGVVRVVADAAWIDNVALALEDIERSERRRAV
jgi:hypothetical protein